MKWCAKAYNVLNEMAFVDCVAKEEIEEGYFRVHQGGSAEQGSATVRAPWGESGGSGPMGANQGGSG